MATTWTRTFASQFCFWMLISSSISATANAQTGSPIGVLFAAGDITGCFQKDTKSKAVADLISKEIKDAGALPSAILVLGDIAYANRRNGRIVAPDYATCFEEFKRSWGHFGDKLLPIPGNHDYSDDPSGNAEIFRTYFAKRLLELDANTNAHYYAMRFPKDHADAWLLVAINFYAERAAQPKWMQAQLAGQNPRCVLAFTHPFLNSSGAHGKGGTYAPMAPFMRVMHARGATVLLSAHDHHFEQVDKQDADGKRAPEDGVRTFVVGTGGATLYPATDRKTGRPKHKHQLSQALGDRSRGVLKLTLYKDGYSWSFVAADGPPIELPISQEECNRRPAG